MQQSEFISSLFNHNPEVPRLSLSDVTPKHEEVFTSEGFDAAGIHPYLVKKLKDSGEITKMTAVQVP